MKALRQERETHLATIEQLKAFEVSQSRFYRLKDTTTGDPIIELTGKNGTPHAVSSVYFEGTLSSTGRSVPWLQETFDHNVPGGIEPGEQAT